MDETELCEECGWSLDECTCSGDCPCGCEDDFDEEDPYLGT